MEHTNCNCSKVNTISSENNNNNNRCGTIQHLNNLIQKDPSIKSKMIEIDSFTERSINSKDTNTNILPTTIITIPVVVHILYNTNAQNVSDAMVNSQINQLNLDFSGTNADITKVPTAFKPLIGNARIRFALAKRDPSNRVTTGIIRKRTANTSFSINLDDVKFTSKGGDNIWNPTQYLNIWVCNLAGNLLGYAQYPGGPRNTDGVVVLYSAFGNPSPLVPYHLGRTCTHEIGHWLNLRHIWGDTTCGNDLVSDTPTQSGPNFGKPVFPVRPRNSCKPTNGPNGDLFCNYMDYVNDDVMVMFTNGQINRMRATFNTGGPRNSLLTSLGATPLRPSNNVSKVSQPADLQNGEEVKNSNKLAINEFDKEATLLVFIIIKILLFIILSILLIIFLYLVYYFNSL